MKQHIKFETKSSLGRIFLSKFPPLINPDAKLLNLGCGGNLFDGWVNADFFTLKFWDCPKHKWMLDLRHPLKCEDDYWDGVFTEHALEHLYPLDTFNLLKEIRRTLKPKAWLRISVPDLGKYISYYRGTESHETFINRWSTGAEAVRSLTQNWGHISAWDSQLLINTLKQLEFINIRQVDFAEGTDKRLLKNKEERRWESLYIEAQKP